MIGAAFAFVSAEIPVNPDAPQGRRWVIDELAKPEFRSAQPTWFDRAAKAVWDWLQSLRIGDGVGVQGPILVVAALVVVACLVAAFVVFGAPRRGSRSTARAGLFGDDDPRDAAAIRRSAEEAASRAQWALAIEESFRAIARGLAERTIISVSPGTTAREFAVRAGAVLPGFSARLGRAASSFDDVRYLGREGTEAAYRSTAELDRELQTARPPLLSVPPTMPTLPNSPVS